MSPRARRVLACCVSLGLLGCGAENEEAPATQTPDFEEFVGGEGTPDVRQDRLCVEAADPDNAPDKVFIDCEAEGARFSDKPAAADSLLVMTYNLERGQRFDEQLAAFESGLIPKPDILLAVELDRGCSRTGYRNVPREVAEALQMDYVFGVEFVELPRESGAGGITDLCEHGNAVFSKYPLGNVEIIRHAKNRSWYIPPEERDGSGEPRLGGRVLIKADVLVGTKLLHTYTVHYESSPADNEFTVAQAVETADHGLAQDGLAIAGGDTNAPFYFLDLMRGTTIDLVTQAFFERGYIDSHAPLPQDERGTRGGLVIDLIFGSEDVFSEPKICPDESCGELSDHLPVWTTVALP